MTEILNNKKREKSKKGRVGEEGLGLSNIRTNQKIKE